MIRISLAITVAVGAVATLPVAAQQNQGGIASPNREETVPLQLKAEQVMAMQQRLNERGFFAGRVDGLWGPDTSAAVTKFQEKNGLRSSGQFDQETLRALGIADASPAATLPQGTAVPVPGSSPDTAGTPSGTVVDGVQGQASQPDGTPGNPPGTAVGRATDRALGTNATGANPGDTNQAVATTSANATQPAKGANSFTDDQARRRMERDGYADVADLKKDGDGVWRGSATKDGAKLGVWLDYKGNVGQQ